MSSSLPVTTPNGHFTVTVTVEDACDLHVIHTVRYQLPTAGCVSQPTGVHNVVLWLSNIYKMSQWLHFTGESDICCLFYPRIVLSVLFWDTLKWWWKKMREKSMVISNVVQHFIDVHEGYKVMSYFGGLYYKSVLVVIHFFFFFAFEDVALLIFHRQMCCFHHFF